MLGLIVKRTTNSTLLQVGSFSLSRITTDNHSNSAQFENLVQGKLEKRMKEKVDAINKETALLKIELKQLLKDKIASEVKKTLLLEKRTTNNYEYLPTVANSNQQQLNKVAIN